jgi:serine/threonine protein kinase/WD40 repeat protein
MRDAPSMSQFRLTATLDSGQSIGFVLAAGAQVIGRDADCAVCLPSEAVSRHHARLTLTADGATLEDLDSTGGTFVNDEPLTEPLALAFPARFRLGPVIVTVEPLVATEDVSTTLAPDADAPRVAKPAASVAPAASASERYVVGREIAKGGMGAILEAKEPALDREVAMKVMLESGESSHTARQRFVREALVLARLEHPNIVPIHEMGRNADGQHFYTMKLVKGRTLHAILTAIKKGDAPTTQHYTLDRLLTIFRKVCDAIAFAHHQRIIHRDLKPENVMVGEFGEVLVMDWGLAKHLDDHQLAKLEDKQAKPAGIEGFKELSDSQLAAGEGNLTLEGAVMGSPQYMPPEQAEGRLAAIGTHSDIYSLGGILYAILTLRHPIEGKHVEEVLAKVISGIITPPTTYNTMTLPTGTMTGEVADARKVTGLPHCPGGKVPASLSAVTLRAMALKPADRYATVAQLMADIEAYQGGFATSAENLSTIEEFVLLLKRHKGVTIAATAALAVIAVLTTAFVGGLRSKEREATRAAEAALSEKEKALKAEKEAKASFAQAQIALAEAAFRSGDYPGMVQALDACPPDKRDPTWAYLSAKREGSLGPLRVPGFENLAALAAVPGQPGQFALMAARGDIGFVDAATGKLLRAVKTGRTGLRELAFSGDGQTFAVRAGKEVDLLDTASGTRRKTLTLPAEPVQQVVLSHDAKLLAAISGTLAGGRPSAQLTLVETDTGKTRWQHRAPTYWSVTIHPNGTRVIASSGGAARFCWVIDADDGREIARHAMYAMCQALHPDGKTIAVGSQQGEVTLVNTSTGVIVQQGKLHSGKLQAMAWTADGHLLTMGEEGKIESGLWLFRLWDPEFLALRATFAGLNPGRPVSWALNPGSGHLITHESPPRLWRIPAGRESVKFSHTSEQAWGGEFLSDTVLLARKSYELVRYDLATPGRATELGGPRLLGTYCAAHPATGLFAIGPKIGTTPFTLRFFATEGAAVVEKHSLVLPALVNDLAFDAPAARLAVTLRNGSLEVFSVKNGESQLKVAGRYQRADFAGSAGHLVAVAPHTVKADAVEFHLQQLDGTTGKVLATATNRFHVQAFAVSPDRKLIALGGSDRSVHLFDADTLRAQPGFRAHDGDVGALTFHPKQPILATASADGSVKVWDHRTGKLLDYFLGLAGNPVVLTFSPDGSLLMVDGQERTTRVYDVAHITAKP